MTDGIAIVIPKIFHMAISKFSIIRYYFSLYANLSPPQQALVASGIKHSAAAMVAPLLISCRRKPRVSQLIILMELIASDIQMMKPKIKVVKIIFHFSICERLPYVRLMS